MKSTRRFSKKWKWVLIGSSVGIVSLAGLSLGIALSSVNKSLQISSPNFTGANSYKEMTASLVSKNYGNFFNDYKNYTSQDWNNFAQAFSINNESSVSDQMNSTEFGMYQINTSTLGDLSNTNLINNTEENLENLLDHKELKLYYYTLDTASFFSSSINLLTDSVINSLSDASDGLVNLNLVSKTTSTYTGVFDSQDGEIDSTFWSPDYQNVGAWIGYLFAQNSGWVTGNLWPCLWALFAGANPTNGTFTFDNVSLSNSNYQYQNASSFAQQLAWTNERRAEMGLGDLPVWAVSLFQTLYNYFGNHIAWNTPYGWWQLQYNNNNYDGDLQYLIQNWVSKFSSSKIVVTISNGTNSYSYTGNSETDPTWASYNGPESSVTVDAVSTTITSESGLVPFVAWIDALTPTLPFYSSGNDTTSTPVLSQKNIFTLLNPSNDYVDANYFVNLSGNTYSTSDPFVYYIANDVVNTLNDGYFSPVLGSNAFYEWASGLYSGMLGYSPYNWTPQSGSESSSYSAGWGVTDTASANILKVIDATNFELLDFDGTNFEGAHYNANGTLNSGDTIITSGSNKNANLLFVANPFNTTNIVSETVFNDYLSSHIVYQGTGYKYYDTWSTYSAYEDFMKYHEITLTDSDLTYAMNHAQAYQFNLNKKVQWVNENGQGVWSIEPKDFNNTLAWMAASMSDYSYDSSGDTLGQVQSNSYMLQEIGIAGADFNLGVGTGFFQTEEYAPNNSTDGDTFTYFLSESNTSSVSYSKYAKTGWTTGTAVPYFLSMLGFQSEFFDPMPSQALAFDDLPSSYDSWKNLTIGELTNYFMGDSSTTGIWNISQELSQALSSGNTSLYNSWFDKIKNNPMYVTLVADETLSGGYSALDYLYGSGLNPATGLPDMQSNLYFNGGYYATPSSFTNSSLVTKIYAPFFDNAQATDIDGSTYYIYGPSRQKLNYIKYEWSANITKEEELALFTSNQISVDTNITVSQLETVSLTGNQSVYFKGVTNLTGTNWACYNAQIYELTANEATGEFDVPMNSSGDPLIQLDINSNNSEDAVVDTTDYDGQTYYGRYGFPYITANGNVWYTDSNETSGVLKSLVYPAYKQIVGTVLNPFIYGTTGAEIRQDIDSLINWSYIANNASYPLKQETLLDSIIPYGNYRGNFEYETPDGEVTVPTFYQYAAATSGIGILGSALYYTYTNNQAYYAFNDWSDNNALIPGSTYQQYYWLADQDGSNGTYKSDNYQVYYGYTLYQWDMINAINNWD